jgi:hypothetical protein
VDPVTTAPEATPPRARPLRTLARIVFIVVALAFAAVAMASEWHDLGSRVAELPAGLVLAAAACTLAASAASFFAWRSMLAGLGAPLEPSVAMPVFFIGQLGKYLPGSVWAFVAQMELGHAAKVRRERTAAAGVVVLLVSLATALVLSLLVVPALLHSGPAYLAVVALVVPVVLVLHPDRLDRLLAAALRRLRRPPLDHSLDGRTILQVAWLALVNNALLGMAVWFLAVHYGEGGELLPLALGGYSLAAAVGLIAVPLPAGAGAREAALVLILAPAVDDGAALLVAIVSRLLMIGTDLLGAGLAAGVRHRTGTGR